MGNITIQGDLTGDVPGGEVGGASNLTTVGAIPYVSAAGALNQDPTALFWDAANNRLGVGTNAPVTALSVVGSVVNGNIVQVQNTASNGYSAIRIMNDGSAEALVFGTGNSTSLAYTGQPYVITGSTSLPLVFGQAGTERARIAATTGNLLIGTTTDSNFKLDVAASGSAGTARFYGGSGVSDNTKLQVRAGAGQSTDLSEWVASNGTTILASVTATGRGFFNGSVSIGSSALDTGLINSGTGLKLGNASLIGWNSAASVSGSNPDLSLSRASAGVLQVGDGGSNANGTLLASGIGLGVSPLPIASYRVLDMDGASGSLISLRQSGTSYAYIYANSATLTIDSRQNTSLKILTGGAEQITVSNLGVTTLYNSTPALGVTRAVIRAGEGQSTTNLTEWQNAAGNYLIRVVDSGGPMLMQFSQTGGSDTGVRVSGNDGFTVGSNYQYRFSSTTSPNASSDLSLYRNAAGVLEINNATPGTYRDLILRRSQHNGVTVANLPTAAAGNAGSIQYVTDANATTIGSTVAGGGANKVMVWSDGAAWKIFAS